MSVIDVSGLTYSYPATPIPALKDITFQVDAGQMVAVIGANGAGKSTLCMALAGLIPALYHGQMQGTVTVAGMDTQKYSPGQFAGQVGLVLQNPANQLSGKCYTVYEEVAFGLENIGIPRFEMSGRIERALKWVGLEDLENRSPYTLSGGQQQRLALASILALEPPILLLDEPTAMLDPHGSQAVFEIVQKLAHVGTTVIIVEHQLEWIARYADRVIALAHGEVLLNGSPGDVLASPLLLQSGIDWLRYTQAAQIGRKRGLWPADYALPVTLEQAGEGFREANKQVNGAKQC
jgi:energy-coupling factor transporter ATP-binding protein EcfA2